MNDPNPLFLGVQCCGLGYYSWRGRCHLEYSPMVPKQSQSYMYISNAEGVIVTQGTPQWYPDNLNPMYVYDYLGTIGGVPWVTTTPSVLRQNWHILCR